MHSPESRRENQIYRTSMAQLMPLFQEQWRTGASVRFSPSGVSMRPMLRQGMDSVLLSPLTEKLKPFDLPLYQREDGKYVLHRIIGTGDGFYICRGDNQLRSETVYPHQMLAVVTAFWRGDRRIAMDSPKHRLYCRLILPLWQLYRRGRAFLGRVKRRLLS